MAFLIHLCFLALSCWICCGNILKGTNQTSDSTTYDASTKKILERTFTEYNPQKQPPLSDENMASLQQQITDLRQSSTQLYLTAEKEFLALKQKVDLFEQTNSVAEQKIQTLTQKLEQTNITAEQEIQILTQKLEQTNISYQQLIHELQTEVNLLKQENRKLKNMSSDLNTHFRYLSLSLLDLTRQTSNISAVSLQNTKTLTNRVQVLDQSLSNVTSLIASMTKKIAFTAGMTSSVASGLANQLVFPKVIFNTGGGYNPETGIFTAPVAGDYVFYVAVESYLNTQLILDITVNGNSKVKIMSWYPGNPQIFQTGTNLVVCRLQQGDRVWVRKYIRNGYYSEAVPTTTFSGFLL